MIILKSQPTASASSVAQPSACDQSRPSQTISQIMSHTQQLLPTKWIPGCIWWKIRLERSAGLNTGFYGSVRLCTMSLVPVAVGWQFVEPNNKILLLLFSLPRHAEKKVKKNRTTTSLSTNQSCFALANVNIIYRPRLAFISLTNVRCQRRCRPKAPSVCFAKEEIFQVATHLQASRAAHWCLFECPFV